LARSVADVDTLENLYLRVLAPPLVAGVVMVLVAILLGAFYLQLGLVLLIFLLLAGVVLPLLAQARGRLTGQRMVQVRSELNSLLVDGIQGVADLLAFGAEQRHLHQVSQLSRKLEALQGRMARASGLQSALSGLLMNLVTLAVLAVAIPLVSGGQLDGVYLALLVLATISSFEAVLPLPQAFQYLENSLEAGRRLFEIVDTEPEVASPASPLPVPDRFDLRLQDVTFAYEPGGPPALDGVSFDLSPGEQVAVVGPSGAGKSTLVHLLVRFWEVQGGRIQLEGRELRDYDPEDLRRAFAVVSQHTHLFNATIRENLLLAKPAASEADLIRAAQTAQLHDFVHSLPQGFDTWIGEEGLRLSAGQRQRLAVARALLKDAPVLILDEPTANLDALTERQVLDTLGALSKGRTTLTVTHRLVGLEEASEILVLRAGHVVERGKHYDLLQMGGLYRRMWDLQNQILGENDAG
jgi:ATP-binding cassette subfamily C protein CydC